MNDQLEMFTIYNNPSDFPGKFVVRRWLACNGPLAADQQPLAVCDSIEQARQAIPAGLFGIRRSANDDPVIVETWF